MSIIIGTHQIDYRTATRQWHHCMVIVRLTFMTKNLIRTYGIFKFQTLDRSVCLTGPDNSVRA